MYKQVVFFGSSLLSNIVLQKLIDANAVSAVVTKIDKPVGRHLELQLNPVKVLAEKNGIPVLASAEGEVGLVAAYGKIIAQETLDKFNGQIFNIHPSLLPKYRGPSPLQQQILDGISETGVTIIQLDAQMDHGPIAAQQKSLLKPDETWISLGERLFTQGAEMFIEILRNEKAQGSLGAEHFSSQNENEATFTKKISRQDGFVPWEEFVPGKLETKLRAYWDWPGVWTIMPDGKRLKLIRVQPSILVQIEGKSPQPWSL